VPAFCFFESRRKNAGTEAGCYGKSGLLSIYMAGLYF
jgi:hypothetical protein